MPNQSIHAFAEKVALVTGVENPVGRAVAIQLALNGAFAVTASSVSEGARSVLGLQELGTLHGHLEIDAGSVGGARSAFEDLEARFGRLDLLVHLISSGDMLSMGDADGIPEPIASLIGMMSSRPSPRIVLIVIGSHVADLDLEAEIRARVVRLSQSTPPNLRFNSILHRDVRVEEGASEPDDVARIAMFLLSGESKAINGQTLVS